MRNWTRSILLSLLLASLCFAPPSKPIRGMQISRTHRLAKNLVGCWLMNEGTGNKLYDLSGYGTTGSFAGGISWTAGKFGSCLTMDGDGDYVDLGTGKFGIDITNQFTVSVWVCINADNPLYTYDNVLKRGTYIHPFVMQYQNKTFRLGVRTTSGTGYATTPTNSVTLGHWHHLALEYNGTDGIFYLDGNYAGTIPRDGETLSVLDGQTTVIGDTANAQADNVMIFNRALSAEEIKALYADPFQMFEEPARQLYAAGGAAAEPERPQIILIGSLTPLTILTASLAFASCKRKAA